MTPTSSPSVAANTEFIWPTLLGEQIVPFRALPAETFVIPLTSRGEVMSGSHPRIDAYPGLATWVRAAEAIWEQHGTSKMTLADQIDHMKKLTQQLPTPPLRVAYAASGMHVAAALVTDPRTIIDSKLYWAAVASESEGQFLVGVLNSPIVTTLVRPLMSYGKDERDIHKHVWRLPIPTYDPGDPVHTEIAHLSRELATEIAGQTFRSANFVTTRRELRGHLAASEKGRKLDQLVRALLGAGADEDALATVVPSGAPTSAALLRVTGGPLDLPHVDVEIDVDCEFDHDGRVYLWGALLSRGPGAEPS